ncbi:hypothetical protein O3P69_000258 [Scylla paramamosain]|uniref:Phosphodiesterase n=1 Tax=Scylla paramamosain TaxID=85552 RepID=A0AAW0UVD7_SCYPA
MIFSIYEANGKRSHCIVECGGQVSEAYGMSRDTGWQTRRYRHVDPVTLYWDGQTPEGRPQHVAAPGSLMLIKKFPTKGRGGTWASLGALRGILGHCSKYSEGATAEVKTSTYTQTPHTTATIATTSSFCVVRVKSSQHPHPRTHTTATILTHTPRTVANTSPHPGLRHYTHNNITIPITTLSLSPQLHSSRSSSISSICSTTVTPPPHPRHSRYFNHTNTTTFTLTLPHQPNYHYTNKRSAHHTNYHINHATTTTTTTTVTPTTSTTTTGIITTVETHYTNPTTTTTATPRPVSQTQSLQPIPTAPKTSADTMDGATTTETLATPADPPPPHRKTHRSLSAVPGAMNVVWAYGCGCRWVWVKALVRLRRTGRRRRSTGDGRRHSILDFMRLQRYAFINNLPSVICASLVTKEEVDRLVQVDVPPPSHFHRDFNSFRYFPRQLPDPCTSPAILSMVESLGMITKFRLSRESLARFTLMVRKGYRDPPYHNWLHAFSVTHFAFLLLQNLQLVERGVLTSLEALALIVSSMCHDLDHRGTTNSFQVASNSVLASLYSSEGSVMERHHLAQAMCILNTDDCNFLENLSREEYTKFLDLMREIILATDLAHHLRILSELRQVAEEGYDSANPRHHDLLICLLMTAADLSDQTKDWHSSKHVAELIYKEFFTQGDLEKAMGNMPLEMMDREKAFIPELQLQFLDDVAIPVYEIVAKLFPEADEPYSSIKANRRNWSRLRDVYKRRKPESTSSLEVFEDDSLEEELEKDES